ncbi:MAG: molybdopterin-dependent oxidoreductase [Pseudomonadota bacterium]
MGHRRRTVLLALAGAGLAQHRLARALDPATGPAVLTLSGKIGKPNATDRAEFDMAMLERLPQRSFTARTPWYREPRKFTGPLLRDVLAAAGAHGRTLKAVALNDYTVEIPFDDALRHDVIVARLLDDKPMPVREKGPLFIVYPFDSKPELRNAVYFSRSAWQLKAIQVQ